MKYLKHLENSETIPTVQQRCIKLAGSLSGNKEMNVF